MSAHMGRNRRRSGDRSHLKAAGPDVRRESPAARQCHTAAAAAVEALEGRRLFALLMVTNLDDDGEGSLRQRVQQAAADENLDEVVFQSGLKGTIELTSGQIFTGSDDLTITGPGADVISVSGTNSSRIFSIFGGFSEDPTGLQVTISGLTLTEGSAASVSNAGAGPTPQGSAFEDEGGAILNLLADLTIEDCVLSANNAASLGGAISSRGGNLVVRDSTISGNTAGGGGGGIANQPYNEPPVSPAPQGDGFGTDASMTVERCTISGNAAQFGGGASGDNFGEVTRPYAILNSTISSNTATNRGGGIDANTGEWHILNSTIVRNSVGGEVAADGGSITPRGNDGLGGGGLNYIFADIELVSTIIADNADVVGPNDVEYLPKAGGTLTIDHSLVENPSPGSITDSTASIIGEDPDLGPLDDNGGPTETHALGENSPAIDQGSNPEDLEFDQRGPGFDRVVGDAADIGAFELQDVVTPPAVVVTVGDVTVDEDDDAVFTVSLSRPLGKGEGPLVFDYATEDGTAEAGEDYQAATGTLTFEFGDPTSRTVTVQVIDDNLDEPDQETFFLDLTPDDGGGNNNLQAVAAAPRGGGGGGPGGDDLQGRATIVDNDPTPTLSINNVTVIEGNAGTVNAVFTVTLSAASGRAVTVNAATANGSATSPADYQQVTIQTLTFDPGQTTRTFTVQVQGDTLDEGAGETFVVNLTGATNATIADNQGTGTITDDDDPPTGGELEIARFVLVDADRDVDLFDLTDGTVINLATLPTRNLNVRAETSSGVASVRFNLDGGGGKIESVLPFALFGDNGPNNNDYRAGRFRTGSHVLAATPFSGEKATGQAGETFDVNFQAVDQPVVEVTRVVLVNADTDEDIMDLTNGTVVDLSTIGTQNLNVRTETTANVQSVRFGLDGNSRFKVESVRPFALFGDNGPNNTDYRAGRFAVGSHTLTVTPYTRGQARGTAGAAITVTFQVVP